MGGHHERPKPGRFSRMVVAYPVAVMVASGGIAIVLAMLAFTAGESELGGSFTDTEDPIVRKLYGFLAMRHDYWTDTGREEDERRRLGGSQRSEAAVHVLVAGAVRRRDAAGALGRDLRVVVEVAGKRRIEGAPPVALRRRERRGRREAAERGAAHALVLGENCAARSFRIDPASAIVVGRQEGVLYCLATTGAHGHEDPPRARFLRLRRSIGRNI